MILTIRNRKYIANLTIHCSLQRIIRFYTVHYLVSQLVLRIRITLKLASVWVIHVN